MQVTIERVTTFNLRNLLGHDCSEEFFNLHASGMAKSTMIWLGRADGVEACAIGVIPATIFSTKAYLWMIDSQICRQHPLRFIRWSRRVLNEVLKSYPTLVGLCSCENVYGRRWLEWLGAKFENTPVNDGHYGFTINGRDDLVLYRITNG
jgi:hypothetical protein